MPALLSQAKFSQIDHLDDENKENIPPFGFIRPQKRSGNISINHILRDITEEVQLESLLSDIGGGTCQRSIFCEI